MYKKIIEDLKPEFKNTIEYLKTEVGKLRAGRATPAMIEDLKVKCYDQTMPLKQLANMSNPQPRTLVIQPWDKSTIENIEKAISQSPLGLTPNTEGETIRINIPPLSQERRKEIESILNEKIEEARISIRQKREDAWKEIQEKEKEGEITEDDKYNSKDQLQKLVDEYNKKIEEIADKKQQEISTV